MRRWAPLLWSFRQRPRIPLRACRPLFFHSTAHRAHETTTSPLQPDPIRLRDYQEECIQSVIAALDRGHKRLGISLATGSGKTVVFTQLIGRIPPPSEKATQTLILAHRRELVEQAARHCARAYPDKTVELELGRIKATGTADITVAGVHSITMGDRILKFDPERFKLVLVDEAHHIVAPAYLRVLRHFNLASKQPDSPYLVGVSATFSRFDGLRLGAAIDEIVYHKDYVDMIGESWLCDLIFTTVESKVDMSKVRVQKSPYHKDDTAGDFDKRSLGKAVSTEEAVDIVVRTWISKASGRLSTLVFAVNVRHVEALVERFRHYGIDARFVTGSTHVRDRAATLDAFKAGEFPVLINCGVFTEGTDLPNIDCVVLARPTRSRNLLVQMIGRGVRLYPGKENCHVIDMVSTLGTGIVTTPTLFGLDPGELVENATLDKLYELRDKKAAEATEAEENPAVAADPGSRSYELAFTDYDSVFDLISDTSGEKHIRSISRFAWVRVGPHRYILRSPGDSYIRLEQIESSSTTSTTSTQESDDIPDTPPPEIRKQPLFEAYEIRRLPAIADARYAAPRKILSAATFSDAVHGCDKYAAEHYPLPMLIYRAPWRSKPASEAQIKLLSRFKKGQSMMLLEGGNGEITKGMAMDMMTKVMHGAKGRFEKLEKEKKRAEKKEREKEMERRMRRRERVVVGPLEWPEA